MCLTAGELAVLAAVLAAQLAVGLDMKSGTPSAQKLLSDV
jgi:hypothetical protein